jgi:hypothetical protein
MTILYEVKTGHTRKVLKAFSKLYMEMGNSRKVMFRMAILAAILFTLPRAMKAPDYGYWICWGFGVFVVLLALARPKISYWSILYQDQYYRENREIRMSFGHSGFQVDDGAVNKYRYAQIQELYADAEMYYLHMDDGDLFVLPKEDFVQGSPEAFYDFAQRNTGKEFTGVNLNLKQKLFRLKTQLYQAETVHDSKVGKKRETS